MNYYCAIMMDKGKKIEYTFYADTKMDALNIAKAKYSGILIRIEERAIPLDIKLKNFLNNTSKIRQKKKVNPDPFIAAIRQLSIMTNAGISIHDALYELAVATEDKNLKDILFQIADDINSGSSLYKSMSTYRYELGSLTLAMVELGEKTGKLTEALSSLANMLEEIRTNFIKFKKAMNYPRNVMVSMIIAFSVIISFVVPKFKDTFASLHTELPLPTKMLLALEYGINNFAPLIIVVLIALFFSFKHLMNTNESFKFRVHELLLKTYLIKKVIFFASINRFTLVFSELIKAGVPISDALDTAIKLIDSLPLKKKLTQVRVSVEKGSSLHVGLKDTGLFENMIIQMVSAGEKGGQLDVMFEKVTEYYKMKFDSIIDNLSDSIEPVMLLLIGVMVTFLALGIFLPMWSMMEAAKTGM